MFRSHPRLVTFEPQDHVGSPKERKRWETKAQVLKHSYTQRQRMQEPSVTQEKNPGSGASWKIRNASRKKTVIRVHTTLFKMDNQQGPSVQKMEFCSMLCGSLDGRKFGRGWIHVYVWLSPFAVHLKLSQCCQSATVHIKLKVKKMSSRSNATARSRKKRAF